MFEDSLKNFYKCKILGQLENIKSNNTGKLRFYSKMCSSFDLKAYLRFDIKKYDRSLLTKIRISAHSLAIETGRYSKPKILASERYCKLCKDKVEDEVHFLLYCPLYKDLREKFDIFNNLNNDDDIKSTIYLLNPVNLVDTRQICNYLSQAFELRNKNLMSVGLQ